MSPVNYDFAKASQSQWASLCILSFQQAVTERRLYALPLERSVSVGNMSDNQPKHALQVVMFKKYLAFCPNLSIKVLHLQRERVIAPCFRYPYDIPERFHRGGWVIGTDT